MLLQTVLMLERRTGPTRGEIDEAALALLARHGAQILATARRYAANPDDAEDAYQRGLEILLTKAPTTSEEELVPWLKTVVKHEAFALRRQRERQTPLTGDGEPVEHGTGPTATHERAERYERLAQGAEALRRLKPQEIRCLVLRAQGLSYREICETTGFTYTKVNRSLTEGRQALTVQLAGIEGGIECARLTPLLSALADGEATVEQLAVLRPHMKTCLACRARLREFRAAPARVATLVPAAVMLGREGGGLRGSAESALAVVQQKVEGALGALNARAEGLVAAGHTKAAAVTERAQTAAELITGQKVAALAASAAALAGGGTAVDQLADHHGPSQRATTAAPQAQPPRAAEGQQAEPPPPVLPPPSSTTEQSTAPQETGPAEPPGPPPPLPDPANEFAPPAPATLAPAASTTAPAPPVRGAPAPSGGGAGAEFAP